MKQTILMLGLLLLNGTVLAADEVLKQPIPDRLVVLTFDDAVSNHTTFVAPLLKKYGFGATFYVCEFEGKGNDRFELDQRQYMTWSQIKSLHDLGFEIGNHTLRHTGMRGLPAEKLLAAVEDLEQKCRANGIAVPTTFGYPGHAISNEAVKVLVEKHYPFARDGGERAYLPMRDHPILIPSLVVHGEDDKRFLAAAGLAKDGAIPVLLFHGVPDYNHPWVTTSTEAFERRMKYLHDNHYTVIALRDLDRYVDPVAALRHQGDAAPVKTK